jgi:hypothetical protein
MIRFSLAEAAQALPVKRIESGDIKYYRLAAWWKCNDWSAFGGKCEMNDQEGWAGWGIDPIRG